MVQAAVPGGDSAPKPRRGRRGEHTVLQRSIIMSPDLEWRVDDPAGEQTIAATIARDSGMSTDNHPAFINQTTDRGH